MSVFFPGRDGMIKEYLNLHKKGVAAFFFFCFAASWMMKLYHLPVEAVLYTAMLCGFFGLILAVLDYRSFRRRHRALEKLKKDILVTADDMPVPRGRIEEDYQEVIRLLAQERLRLEEKTDEDYRELVEYYTIWAHQIKTPIAAMRLLMQEMEERALAEEYGDEAGTHSLLFELKDELRRVEQYVEMVLCYLRLDAGTTDYVIREYDLDRIIRQAVRRNASVFIRKKLRLNYEPLGVRVVTDEKWLLFVIEQILSNALKYTPAGEISITLEKPKTLCIRDSGIGIAPEDLPRIFEKGYTGCNGRTDKKASGIGMYLCRRICGNLGHTILVTSREGEGTEVRLDLKNAELEIE